MEFHGELKNFTNNSRNEYPYTHGRILKKSQQYHKNLLRCSRSGILEDINGFWRVSGSSQENISLFQSNIVKEASKNSNILLTLKLSRTLMPFWITILNQFLGKYEIQ